MSKPVKNLSAIIDRIKTDTALTSDELAGLSDLPIEDIIKIRMTWEFLPAERKRSIAEHLIELEDIHTTLSFDNLFRFMLSDRDEQVKILAIKGLWENDQPSLLEPLVRLLEKDKSQKVRAEAASALGKYALLAEMGKLREALAVRVTTVLFRAVDDPNENIEVKARALESVSVLSQPKVTDAVNQAYTSDNSRLRLAAIYAMGHNASYMWIPILTATLKSDEPAERYEAVLALGEMEDQGAVEYLRPCTKDEDLEVRLATVETLKKIGGREAKSLLGEMSDDPNANIVEAAKEALSEMEDPNSLKVLDDDVSINEDEDEDEDEDESYSAS
jgi:HEAT repeat protein